MTTTPGNQSARGQLFRLLVQDVPPIELDYVFDNATEPGVVYVRTGWWDEYGGRGCASGTITGDVQPLAGGGWQVGPHQLQPVDAGSYQPALTRQQAASYARGDSLSAPADP